LNSADGMPSNCKINKNAQSILSKLAMGSKASRDHLKSLFGFSDENPRRQDAAQLNSTINNASKNIGNAIAGGAVYPTQTQTVGSNGGVMARVGSGPSLGRWALDEVARVIGRVPRAADPKSFVLALNNAFQTREFEGRTIVEFKPNGYLANDGAAGMVTGAQASVSLRARTSLNTILPLLNRLRPLRLTPDEEEITASRQLIIDRLTLIAEELGNEGGPRLQRIDDAFDFLLSEKYKRIDDDVLVEKEDDDGGPGEIGRLGDLLGLTDDNVNTVIEEQLLTDFQYIRDDVEALKTAFDSFAKVLQKDGNLWLGIVIARLTRVLGVIVESVHELEDAFDSVLIGEADRQSIQLQHEGGSLSVDDLLSWIEEFAEAEALQAAQDGGKSGIRAIKPTLENLIDIFGESPQYQGTVPGGDHQRIQLAWAGLSQNLKQAQTLVENIQ
jgi:hypothetical protein